MTIDAMSAGAPSAPAPVEARGLTKRFGPLTAVDRLNFAAPRGAITGFLGPNGAGLGSLLRSQLAGVVGVFVWALIVESVIGGIFTSVRPYLPYTAATTLAGVQLGVGPGGFRVAVRTSPGTAVPAACPLPFAAAAGMVAAVAAAVAIVAWLTTVRRDVA